MHQDITYCSVELAKQTASNSCINGVQFEKPIRQYLTIYVLNALKFNCKKKKKVQKTECPQLNQPSAVDR